MRRRTRQGRVKVHLIWACAITIILVAAMYAPSANADPGYSRCLVSGNHWCGGPVNAWPRHPNRFAVVHRAGDHRIMWAWGLPTTVQGSYAGGIRGYTRTRCNARGAKVDRLNVGPHYVYARVAICRTHYWHRWYR
jgi:hypothetical protein